MFRPVDSETIAEIVSRVDEEKQRLSQLSASSMVSATGDDDNDNKQSLSGGGESSEAQPMMVDEPVELVTSDPLLCPGLSLPLLSPVLFFSHNVNCNVKN